MIGISSVLLDIHKADFIEPAADSDETLRAWEITVDTLTDIMNVHLQRTSNNLNSNITVPVQNLKTYLSQRGISNEIRFDNPINQSINPSTNVNGYQVSTNFSVWLSSNSLTITQNITLTITYTADFSTAGQAIISKSINGQLTYLAGCQFTLNSGSGSLDVAYGNGYYEHSYTAGSSITVVTPSTVSLTFTLV